MPADPIPSSAMKRVQQNLTNMQHMNDQIYNFGLSKYMNAFALLTEQDNDDLGLQIGLNIVEGAFWAVGSVGGPAGSFFASFLSGMLVYWATDPPASINGSFAQNVLRFQATTQAVDAQLALYSSDLEAHWNDSFTYNGTTYKLSDLAGFDFPNETSTDWNPMVTAALVGVDQSLWQALLVSSCVVTYYVSSGDGTDNGNCLLMEYKDQNSEPDDWVQGFYSKNPAYYEKLSWYSGDPNNCCGPPACWETAEYNIGTGASTFSDGSLSADACTYLFIDSTPGVIINPKGLFKRVDLFTNLGIKTATQYVPNFGAAPGARLGNVSVPFLRAMKDQNTLGQLVAREGRAAIERRIVEKAQADSIFAHDLVMRPRQTVEKFLGVKIPEVIAVNVMQELPWSFGIVIPAQKWDGVGGSGAGANAVKAAVERFFGAPPRTSAAAASGLKGVYQVVLSGPSAGEWVIRVDTGQVSDEKGRAPNPDVTMRATDADWANMASGKLDSLQAFFLGRLAVEGDLVAARKLRDLFASDAADARQVT